MLSYQKQTLLALLANLKNRVYDALISQETPDDASITLMLRHDRENKAYNIIDRNLTSIEKQLRRL